LRYEVELAFIVHLRHEFKTENTIVLYAGADAFTCAESFLTKRGRNPLYVYWTALVMCAGALLSLPIINVDVTVQEHGRVRPATERTAIVARTADLFSRSEFMTMIWFMSETVC